MILLRAKVDVLNLVTYLNQHLYLSGMWFGVVPRIEIRMTCVQQGLDCVLKTW